MNSFDLFEEFKSCCKDYKIELGNLIINNNGNTFILRKLQSTDEVIFEIIPENNRRISSATSDIEELLEAAKDVVGDKIITHKQSIKYSIK